MNPRKHAPEWACVAESPPLVFLGEFRPKSFSDKGEAVLDQMLAARKFRTQFFEHADRWFHRLVGLMTALHEGVWLGCLSADDLNAVTAKHFDESQYYASSEHNLSGFFNWELPLLDRYCRAGSRILVAAAGAGREILALRKAGFDAQGFECSLPLVHASEKILDQLGEGKYVTYCPPDSVPQGPAIYQGLIVGWGGYTHIPTRLRRIAFLQAMHRRAMLHSPLIVSFFTPMAHSYDTVVYRTATLCRHLLRAGEEPVSPRDRLAYGRYVHLFTRDEVEEELRTAGFRVVHYGEQGGAGQAVGIAE